MKNKSEKFKLSTFAFTLIELLAVIVILAIIALIATPIILGIIEDTKKDAFLRSVELVISTTDIDIANKVFEEKYTYIIKDGNISDLEIGIKNIEGMNGSISYDIRGKEVYAIHNDAYCVKKLNGMKKAKIASYIKGKCYIPTEFEEFVNTSQVNDKKITGMGQLINLGIYGIRYQGNNPNNYIYFNCSDYNNPIEETCELWRIIGIVDNKVKIIGDSIGEHAWVEFTSNNPMDRLNLKANWNESLLKSYLNESYYSSLTDETKNSGIISPSTWYLRGINSREITKEEVYNIERTEGTIVHEPSQIDNVKLGIMYSSDWAFGAMETENCLSTTTLPNYESCVTTNWLSNERFNKEWTITPSAQQKYQAMTIYSGSELYVNAISEVQYTRPVLYLSPDVNLHGEGTENRPYYVQINNIND